MAVIRFISIGRRRKDWRLLRSLSYLERQPTRYLLVKLLNVNPTGELLVISTGLIKRNTLPGFAEQCNQFGQFGDGTNAVALRPPN